MTAVITTANIFFIELFCFRLSRHLCGSTTRTASFTVLSVLALVITAVSIVFIPSTIT